MEPLYETLWIIGWGSVGVIIGYFGMKWLSKKILRGEYEE